MQQGIQEKEIPLWRRSTHPGGCMKHQPEDVKGDTEVNTQYIMHLVTSVLQQVISGCAAAPSGFNLKSLTSNINIDH